MPSDAVTWADARDLVDHNEFGLAFDVIVDALIEADAPEAARPAFAHLGASMTGGNRRTQPASLGMAK